MAKTRKQKILNTVNDLAGKFLYYDRKEDDELPVGAIEKDIKAGKITVDEIVAEFRGVIESSVKS